MAKSKSPPAELAITLDTHTGVVAERAKLAELQRRHEQVHAEIASLEAEPATWAQKLKAGDEQAVEKACADHTFRLLKAKTKRDLAEQQFKAQQQQLDQVTAQAKREICEAALLPHKALVREVVAAAVQLQALSQQLSQFTIDLQRRSGGENVGPLHTFQLPGQFLLRLESVINDWCKLAREYAG